MMEAEKKKKFTVLVLSNEAVNDEIVEDLQRYCCATSRGEIGAKDIVFVTSDSRDPHRQYADLEVEQADVVLRFMWEEEVRTSKFVNADLYKSQLLRSLAS